MNLVDFTFSCEWAEGRADSWSALRVARIHGREEISALYRYEIVLLAPLDPPSVEEFVGHRATLRIATNSTPALKTVHGVVTEAEEIAALAEGRAMRVVLMPAWARATHRRRCRIFLEKTPRQIIESVLSGDPLVHKAGGEPPEPDLGGPDFAPAREAFAWRIEDSSRLDSRRVRPFVVQYNESDFAFASRLLEEEGVSFHIENGADTTLLVLSDSDAGRPRLAPDLAGAGIDGREIARFFRGARLRPEGVVLGDYNWKQPSVGMTASAGARGADLVEHVYPGGYPDEASQGRLLAGARLDRHKTEARFARGEGSLRVLSAGTVFKVEHKKARLEGEYLVTSLSVRGEQAGVLKSGPQAGMAVPFEARFECACRGEGTKVKESRFRPALATQRPRIHGSQTAVVTAEPSARSAEINLGGPDGIDVGCVRLRFHWDTEEARLAKEPSSAWVRVNEPFAGSGMGGVWHPRVGTEVIVEFEEGDPDRPLVVGRVYNGVNRPHRGGAPAVSTLKSNASPGGAVHNEITFDDAAGAELVYTNAGKDMETDVGNDRKEAVAVDASMTVGADDTETIGANCAVLVGANEGVTVGANDTSVIGGNVVTVIGANSTTLIGGSEVHVVGANQSIGIGATHTEIVGGSVTEGIGGTLTTDVSSSESETIGADRTTTIAGAHTQSFGAAHIKVVGGNHYLSCKGLKTQVGAASIQIVGGKVATTVHGAHTLNTFGGAIFLAPRYTAKDKDRNDINGLKLSLTGAEATVGMVSISGTGAALSFTGASVSVAGLSLDLTAAKLALYGCLTRVDGGHMENNGIKTRVGFVIKL